MNTIMIFDQCEANIRFIAFESDLSHLDRVYINGDFDEKLTTELYNLIYDQEGSYKVTLLEKLPIECLHRDTVFIVAGFYL